MTFGDIVWVIIISIGISVACWYSKIEWPIVVVLVIGGYFIYGIRKSVLRLLDEIEKLKSEKK